MGDESVNQFSLSRGHFGRVTKTLTQAYFYPVIPIAAMHISKTLK